jgi:ferredoxin
MVPVLPCLLAASAHGAFTGAVVEDVGNPTPGETTWRVYAVFDAADDRLLWVGGDPDHRLFHFVTDTIIVNHGGAFAGLKQEDFAGHPLSGLYDTWVTIKHDVFAGNDTNYDLCFPCIGCGSCIGVRIVGIELCDYDDEGWFDMNPSSPALPDAKGRIVIAQFTVADTSSGERGRFWLDGTAEWLDNSGAIHRAGFRVATTCDGDVDASGTVAFADLLRILARWGTCSSPGYCLPHCPEDLDRSSDVGIADLLLVLSNWGPCAP